MRHHLFWTVLLFVVVACGDQGATTPTSPGPQSPQASGGSPSHHGAIVALGRVVLGGEIFAVARHGECKAGEEGAFVVSRIGAGSLSALYLWVEDAAGDQISAPAQGDRSEDEWHFHVTPRSEAEAPASVVVRTREEGRDERADLPIHPGAAPVHDGTAAPLLDSAGAVAGWIELKLHDDKGDLELWLAQDSKLAQPLDLPLGAVLKVTFHDHEDREVELRVRNRVKNEDENGTANVRPGGTNYFIFPGDSSADASWLQGVEFKSPVSVVVPGGGDGLTAGPFVLAPHGHGEGDHDH